MSTPLTPAARLAARALCCIRSDQLIFDDLDFAACAGEIWQVIGPNGAGKTSLLRVLAGLSPPAGGSLTWCGEPLPEARDAFQQDLLFLGHLPAVSGFLSARENLDHARLLGASPTAMPVPQALDRVGLANLDELPGQRMSAGQRQRLALARFLLNRATLWIMDEPMTALDADGRAMVESLLAAHARSGGIAIVSTHQALDLPAGVLQQFRVGGNGG